MPFCNYRRIGLKNNAEKQIYTIFKIELEGGGEKPETLKEIKGYKIKLKDKFVDQHPIGPKLTEAIHYPQKTYDAIRELFAAQALSKIRATNLSFFL